MTQPAPRLSVSGWIAFAAAVGLALGALLGWVAFAPRHPGDDSADAGFARDMSEHHAQAVEMSLLVMQRTDDPDVVRLASDIATSQAYQQGQMGTWLVEWGLPQARPGERMAWMAGHDHATMDMPAGVPMPGMATPAEIAKLTSSRGKAAEVLYLQLMTTHHLAGVEMARAGLDLGRDPQVRSLAEKMVRAQSGEVELMTTMLTERGSQPREDVSAIMGPNSPSASTPAEESSSTMGGHSRH
ncbi:DUF305 domain-containing protein [Kribbia dieselivorans]|uniref:DUF305 domain-containing protein n=1 Tax=Kribbia dieselivorans TaxID=331526 RepID=UPI0009F9ED7A|nr:DUF305 domain-containing protein [Kribbia dieselivorans]